MCRFRRVGGAALALIILHVGPMHLVVVVVCDASSPFTRPAIHAYDVLSLLLTDIIMYVGGCGVAVRCGSAGD